MKNPKTFVAYGHRYKIVFVAPTKKRAQDATGMYQGRSDIRGIALHELSSGKWAVGIRK